MDIIAVACNAETAKTKGPDHVWVATAMQASGRMCRVSIFRPLRRSLPRSLDGDVIILRNFRVSSFARKLYLKSQEDSSWAIFSRTEADPMNLRISMPDAPVEYSTLELEHVGALHAWWTARGHQLVPEKPIKRSSVKLSEVKEKFFFDIKGEIVIKPTSLTHPFVLYITDYSSYESATRENGKLETLATYQVAGEDANCLVLPIELRMQDAKYAFHKFHLGQLILCENVLALVGLDGHLYGSIEAEISGKTRVSLAEP